MSEISDKAREIGDKLWEERLKHCGNVSEEEAIRQQERRREQAVDRYLSGEISDWGIVEQIHTLSRAITEQEEAVKDLDVPAYLLPFYQAFSSYKSPQEAMEVPALKVITMEVIDRMRCHPTSSTKFKSRTEHVHFIIGKLVKGHGFPPDLNEQ